MDLAAAARGAAIAVLLVVIGTGALAALLLRAWRSVAQWLERNR
jgi:Tfp pilus assembly protein PilV